MSLDSLFGANKATVLDGTKRLTEISEGGISVQELKELNGMKLQEMRDWVAKEQAALVAPQDPGNSGSHEAGVQYHVDNKAYLEMQTVLIGFDTAINNLKKQYEGARGQIQGAAKEDLAALSAALKDTTKKDTATGETNGGSMATKNEEGAAGAKTAEAKTAVPSAKGDGS